MYPITRHPANVGISPTMWVRASHVADRWGVTPRMLVADLEARRLPIRYTEFGARGLIHLAVSDVIAYEASLLHPAPGAPTP